MTTVVIRPGSPGDPDTSRTALEKRPHDAKLDRPVGSATQRSPAELFALGTRPGTALGLLAGCDTLSTGPVGWTVGGTHMVADVAQFDAFRKAQEEFRKRLCIYALTGGDGLTEPV